MQIYDKNRQIKQCPRFYCRDKKKTWMIQNETKYLVYGTCVYFTIYIFYQKKKTTNTQKKQKQTTLFFFL